MTKSNPVELSDRKCEICMSLTASRSSLWQVWGQRLTYCSSCENRLSIPKRLVMYGLWPSAFAGDLLPNTFQMCAEGPGTKTGSGSQLALQQIYRQPWMITPTFLAQDHSSAWHNIVYITLLPLIYLFYKHVPRDLNWLLNGQLIRIRKLTTFDHGTWKVVDVYST